MNINDSYNSKLISNLVKPWSRDSKMTYEKAYAMMRAWLWKFEVTAVSSLKSSSFNELVENILNKKSVPEKLDGKLLHDNLFTEDFIQGYLVEMNGLSSIYANFEDRTSRIIPSTIVTTDENKECALLIRFRKTLVSSSSWYAHCFETPKYSYEFDCSAIILTTSA